MTTLSFQQKASKDFLCWPAYSHIPYMVPTARLELAQLSPLPPQDSVSTNFTTSAITMHFNSAHPSIQRGFTESCYVVIYFGISPACPTGLAGKEVGAETDPDWL